MNNNKNSLSKFYRFYLPLLIVIGLLLLLLTAQLSQRSASLAIQDRMRSTLAFQTETLKVSMDKYAVMTALIARRLDVLEALKAAPIDKLPSAEYLTTIIAGMSGASDIWVVNTEGKILTSNNPLYLNTSISNEAYFKSSLLGVLGRASFVDDVGRRFYIFSAPVFNGGDILGAVVVRVNLEFIEYIWALFSDPILVTNKTNTVLLSNVEHLRLSYFETGYVRSNSESLLEVNIPRPINRMVIDSNKNDNRNTEYLVESTYIPLLGWDLHILADYQPVITERNSNVVTVSLLLILLLMGLWVWFARQQRVLEQQRAQQAFAIRLERQVRDRTHALSAANEQLEIEVGERKQVEKELREAQEELIQAAKLAGIGQMSTALAHEYNQPLAALRSYTENTASYLKMQAFDDAKENLQRINLLIDRMANMTRTLRNFAHKSSGSLETIALSEVIDELIILLAPQAKKQHVDLVFAPVDDELTMVSDHGRLSQVLTNLITNAMDAVEHASIKKVTVSCKQQEELVTISVTDTGLGIPLEIKEKIFDPFFTTKQTGKGIGLGLFIVQTIIKQLKGRLTLESSHKTGTTFIMSFPVGKNNHEH